ncbi:hypothetical protein OHA18_41310 [Kribbella sp. NBC_00709]|uniref:hypothetical protein n=1 Tax=Kribbella sp. NBC_00709 TaxID=2975972 RepID=UPI002E2CA3DF|nr:hypothetical protein [Kribbella sp. NBC_00709]
MRRTSAHPRLDVGFEAALGGDRERAAEALIHGRLIELVTTLAARVQAIPETSQVEVVELLIPAVSAWAQAEQGWMVFDRLPAGAVDLSNVTAEFVGAASQSDQPLLASFASQVLAGYLAGKDEELRQGFLKRAGVERRSAVALDPLEAAPAGGQAAVAWMIDLVRRSPDAGPAALAEACEARFGTSGVHSQAIELVRLLGYGHIWADPRSDFLADCLRTTLLLGDAAHISTPDLEFPQATTANLSHAVQDEEFATDVLQALTNRLSCLLPVDGAFRVPQTMDRYLLLARLSKLMADVATLQRTKDVCAVMFALAQPKAESLNQWVFREYRRFAEGRRREEQRARRNYLAVLVGWIPVTVLWSYLVAMFTGDVQHFLWPVFIWLSSRTLRSLARFRATLDLWPTVVISVLYVIGYVAGRALVDNGTHWTGDLLPHLTLGTVLAATGGFLVALVSIAYPKRIEQTAIEVLPEGLPDDWQDSAGEELSMARRGGATR